MAELPGSVLFACTHNIIRSVMAEGLMKLLHGSRVYVQSAGVRPGEPDPFVAAVMDELGIDVARHQARTFEELDDSYFDLVISLSPEAQHQAVELTRSTSCELEFWRIPDPSLVEGTRDARLEAYRHTRDLLMRQIRTRFPPPAAPRV